MGKGQQPQRRRSRLKKVRRTFKLKTSAAQVTGSDFATAKRDVNGRMQTGPTSANAIYWSPTRLRIREWLEQHSIPLAELYRASVELMFDPLFPARVRLIGHCVREICNGLPYAIVMDGLPPRGRFDYESEADGLIEKWEQAGLSLAGKLPQFGVGPDALSTPPSPDNPVCIPRDLFDALGRFLAQHQAVRIKRRDVARRLFAMRLAAPPSELQILEPVVRRWLEVTETFMARTHESGKLHTDADEAEMRGHFNEFEDYLTSFSRPFFETLGEIDAILEDANS